MKHLERSRNYSNDENGNDDGENTQAHSMDYNWSDCESFTCNWNNAMECLTLNLLMDI